MQHKFARQNTLPSVRKNVGMNVCILKYIKSPAMSTTTYFNLVVRSSLAFLLYML